MGERRELFGSGMTAAIRGGAVPSSTIVLTEAELAALMAGEAPEPVTFAHRRTLAARSAAAPGTRPAGD